MSEQNPAETPQTGIRAFDQEGREVVVPRDEWAANVLPNMVHEAWADPDRLYNLILSSLNDGFLSEIADAAKHLYETDPIPARGACMWGIVLMQTGSLEEAERVLTGHNQAHGEDASVLVNIAKLHASRQDMPQAEATLVRALELEPNLDNGLGWYAAMLGERAASAAAPGQEEAAGQQASREALERIAAMPTSWRAQLWIARLELQAGKLDEARALYTEALSRAPRPLPIDFLMQVSGDLGGAGHLQELIQFTAPEFLPEAHGLPVGNNLIKAFVDTNQLGNALIVVNALVALNRPDWRDTLTFWQDLLAKRNAAAPDTAAQQQVQIGMLRVDGPVWLPAHSPARSLFAGKQSGAPSVTFLGGTVELPQGPEPQGEAANAVSRMSRALPLFLAEQVELRTAAAGRTMFPWAVATAPGQPSGFVVSASRWPDQDAVQMVSDPANLTDYVVSVHLDAEVEPWTVELAFIRTADAQRIGELEVEFPSTSPASALVELANDVVELLASLGRQTLSQPYQLPQESGFPLYLQGLEHLLSLRCTSLQTPAPQSDVLAEEALQTTLELSAADPVNVPARLLLIETLAMVSAGTPQLSDGLQDRVRDVLVQHPIPLVDAAFIQTPA